MKMVNLIKGNNIRRKLILLFITAIIFTQVYIDQAIADEDEIKDGVLEINAGDWINIQCGTNKTILWQFQVDTNERAIYWEITGYNVFNTGWGSSANCTTPILNETNARYEYVCHGYYAKYHVWSTMIVTCTKTGQTNGGGDGGPDPIIILSIVIPVISVGALAIAVVIYLKRKKKQDFF